jgi:hypothetical protein
MSTTSSASAYRYVITVTPNGRSAAEEKARIEKKLGRPVSYLGRVMQAARATEARTQQQRARGERRA